MNQLDLLSIRSFYRKWIHSNASDRRCVVISIGPDPILNQLEGVPIVHHWTLEGIEEFRRSVMTPMFQRNVPRQWFYDVFECLDYNYPPPPFIEQDRKRDATENQN